MKFKISRIERATHQWHVGFMMGQEACPICGRYWVSLKKDCKLYHISNKPAYWVPSGGAFNEGVVCSSRCVDMWILQHV
jgi:hypothetical protein